MQEFFFGFFTIAVISLLGAASPGPDVAMIVKNSLTRSRRDGVATAFGIILGNIFYITLVLLGLGAVLTASAAVFTVLKYFGAVYLIYLGIKLLSAKAASISEAEVSDVQTTSVRLSIREGFLTNVSNPKFMVFLIAVFTQVITPTTPLAERIIFGFEIPVFALMWFVTLSFIITTPMIRLRLAGILHYIERITGAVLIGLGIKIALDAHK